MGVGGRLKMKLVVGVCGGGGGLKKMKSRVSAGQENKEQNDVLLNHSKV